MAFPHHPACTILEITKSTKLNKTTSWSTYYQGIPYSVHSIWTTGFWNTWESVFDKNQKFKHVNYVLIFFFFLELGSLGLCEQVNL